MTPYCRIVLPTILLTLSCIGITPTVSWSAKKRTTRVGGSPSSSPISVRTTTKTRRNQQEGRHSSSSSSSSSKIDSSLRSSFLPSDGWFSSLGSRESSSSPSVGETKTTTTTKTTPKIPKLIVLIPAYNEEQRIESTIQAYRTFLLQSGYSSICQILVIDDGSTDRTVEVVQGISCTSSSTIIDHSTTDNKNRKKEGKDDDIIMDCPIQCLSLPENQGKGAALAAGIQYVVEQCRRTGEEQEHDDFNSTLILTQDADGSGDLRYLDSMMECMKELLLTATSVKEQRSTAASFLPLPPQSTTTATTTTIISPSSTIDWSQRAIVMGNRNYNLWSPRGITRWGFQTVVKWIMNDLRVQDSQCGYKLMTLKAANDLYEDLEVQGWAHDVEVLYRAKLVNIPIREIPIDWVDKDGSKVVQRGVGKVSLEMLFDVIKLRWRYSIFRAWLSLGDF